jgi:hypothetical protein
MSELYENNLIGLERMTEVVVETFGFPEVAARTLMEYTTTSQDGADHLGLWWADYINALKLENRIGHAFANAWPDMGVTPYLIGRGLQREDAEDIQAETMIAAWRALERPRYFPWLSNWTTFLFTISKRLMINHWKRRRLETMPLEDVETQLYVPPIYPKEFYRGWGIDVVCREWAKDNNLWKKRLAAYVILARNNVRDWTGFDDEALSYVGLTRTTAHRYLGYLAIAVKNLEA